MSDEEDTKVTRPRPLSAAMRRASSSVIPRVADIGELPPGPEQEEALAEVFGQAMDLITASSKELVTQNARLAGELANAQQEIELSRSERARLIAENNALREQLRAARGGR